MAACYNIYTLRRKTLDAVYYMLQFDKDRLKYANKNVHIIQDKTYKLMFCNLHDASSVIVDTLESPGMTHPLIP